MHATELFASLFLCPFSDANCGVGGWVGYGGEAGRGKGGGGGGQQPCASAHPQAPLLRFEGACFRVPPCLPLAIVPPGTCAPPGPAPCLCPRRADDDSNLREVRVHGVFYQ